MNPENFLNSLVNYEKIQDYDYNLEDYRRFLRKLDSPQKKLKNVLLIGGTKGKGSTAAIINTCLIHSGYKVGLYTSPHLRKVNERIKTNNKNISENDLEKYIRRIKPFVKQTQGIRTYFEVLTTIAFLHFINKKTDFAILEVGLGGRLDATNVTEPLMSVITKIGYDHTALLGNTLPKIASEKSGIIKRRGKLITVHQRSTVDNILKRAANRKKSSLIYAEGQHIISVTKASIKGSRIKIKGKLGKFETFLPLVGRHQIQNLSLALAVLNELKKTGFRISVPAVKKGVSRTSLHGRFEIIAKKPLIIYDCAHNRDSFEALYKNLNQLKIKNFSLIFGCKKNKNIRYCLRNIFPKAKEVVLVQSDDPPGMEPTDIYKMAKRYQKKLTIMPPIKRAVKYLKTKVRNNSVIIITGSFYLWNDMQN